MQCIFHVIKCIKKNINKENCELLLILANVITLTILGIIDFKIYKIPNIVLVGWVITIFIMFRLNTIPIKTQSLVLAGLTTGIYFPLRQIVKCNGGDFKLFAVIMLAMEPYSALATIFISMILSLIPLVSGVKKVPMAYTMLLGYTAFLFFTYQR